MKTLVFFLTTLFLVPLFARAEFSTAPIEEVAAAYAGVQEGLQGYQADIETDRIGEIFRQMTAAIPADLPKPEPPSLVLSWSRETGATTVSAQKNPSSPYINEMIQHFSAQFTFDMPGMFLPVKGAEDRRRILKEADLKVADSQLATTRSLIISATFRHPVSLGGAFYHISPSLPQEGITSLTLDLDPDQKILRRMEIGSVSGQHLTVELRHVPCSGGYLLQEVHITSPDGLTDERFRTTFGEFDGYLLPIRQEQSRRRPGVNDQLQVDFVRHRLNPPATVPTVRDAPP